MASHSGWGFETTASEVADTFPDSIRGRTILITGVSLSGLGGTTAKALAAYFPKLLIFTGRTRDRVEAAIAEIQHSYLGVQCRFLLMDLASQTSVHKAAAEVLAYDDVDGIDLLINNAGVMDIQERTLSPDGIEMQFATNHIGHFLFTNLIMPKLISAAARTSTEATSINVRVLNVSSVAHVFGPVRFSDYNFSKPLEAIPKDEWPSLDSLRAIGGIPNESSPYIPFAAYGQSKTANILFSLSLTAKLASKHNITSFSLHPGSIPTELQRNSDQVKLAEARRHHGTTKRKDLEQGSSTTLVASLDPGLAAGNVNDGSGLYLDDCQIASQADWAKDPKAAERLWLLSEELVQQKFEL
jgi:NAD(P)-dependent dehydrogenase (short-subunit alcohol dehydrogenase family)